MQPFYIIVKLTQKINMKTDMYNKENLKKNQFCVYGCQQQKLFFLSEFSFTDTDDSQDSMGRERTIIYSTLPPPPAHEHSDIYLQLCMRDGYHIFLIAPPVFTRMLLDEIYHLIELLFN